MEEKIVKQETKSFPKRVGQKTLDAAKAAVRSLIPETAKIPVEEINAQTIAAIINKYLGNPVQQKFQNNRWENPFSIVDVLANTGYSGFWSEKDYRLAFPQTYDKTRTALNDLSAKGALEVVGLAEPDKQGEAIYYKVVNEGLLEEIANRKVKTQST